MAAVLGDIHWRAMPSRLAIQKLRRHLHGLDTDCMSSSYPQETGETEFREMLAAVRKSQSEGKVDTSVRVQDEQTDGQLSSFLESVTRALCGKETSEQQTDTDEVDGRVEELFKPLVKLYFLKILFINLAETLEFEILLLNDVLTKTK